MLQDTAVYLIHKDVQWQLQFLNNYDYCKAVMTVFRLSVISVVFKIATVVTSVMTTQG